MKLFGTKNPHSINNRHRNGNGLTEAETDKNHQNELYTREKEKNNALPMK